MSIYGKHRYCKIPARCISKKKVLVVQTSYRVRWLVSTRRVHNRQVNSGNCIFPKHIFCFTSIWLEKMILSILPVPHICSAEVFATTMQQIHTKTKNFIFIRRQGIIPFFDTYNIYLPVCEISTHLYKQITQTQRDVYNFLRSLISK